LLDKLNTEINKVEAEAKAVFSFGASHLVLIIALGLACFAGVYEFDSRRAQAADTKAAIAEAKYEEAAKTNSAVQAQTAQQIALLAQQNLALQSQNTLLAQSLAARRVAESQLPTQNASLTTQDAADKIQGLTNGKATPNGSDVVLDTPTARTVVSQLELVPLLQADKADLEKRDADFTKEIDNDVAALDLEKKAHVSDNETCKVQVAAKDAEITKVKADAKRTRNKFFVVGTVIGFILRGVAGF